MAFSVRVWALGLCLAVAGCALALRAAAEAGSDASLGNPRADPRRAQVLVKGDGFSITVGALEDHINKQPAGMRTRYSAREERKALLESLVRLELLGREAAARGMAESPAVLQTIKDGAAQALVRSEVDDKVTAESVTKAEIAAFYAEHPEEFHHPAERRASHIAVDTREHALSLLAEAKKTDLRGFAELARKHSLDAETKLRGGDLAFFTREPGRDPGLQRAPEALRKAVFGLKTLGDIAAEPVPNGDQFSIVRWTGERPERHVTLADAEGSIRARLWRERRHKAVDDLINGLRAQQKPQIFADRVELVKFDDMDKRPTGFMPDPALSSDGGAVRAKAKATP